ncbi:MAG: CAP domain-containing protein [Campylobacter sp.]|nr:CAP domain-containing protein [Campylobacter sp.]
MPKQALWLSAIILFFLSGCESDQSTFIKALPPQDGYIDANNPLSYLNSVRFDSGLRAYKIDPILEMSARNHANYLAQNGMNEASLSNHAEAPGGAGFTGENPSQRALAVGYQSLGVSENISFNDPNFIYSIDNLLSAIYHRFGFLNYNTDSIGFASVGEQKDKIYVYNMGNSGINSFCKMGISDKGYGEFYGNFCKNQDIKIKKDKFESLNSLSSMRFIVYPAKKAQAFFGGEVPDPYPKCKITANPVSIEFSKFSKNILMKSFKIFDENGGELDDTFILTKDNDMNALFSDKQFAVFSNRVFDFDKTYKAVFEYFDGEDKKIEWEFKTKTPNYPYFVVRGGEKLLIEPNKEYDLFFYPKNCNDEVKNYSYKTMLLKDAKITTSSINTIHIKTDGYKNGKLTLNVPGFESVWLYIDNNSPNAKSFAINKFVLFGVGFLAIVLLIIRKIFK